MATAPGKSQRIKAPLRVQSVASVFKLEALSADQTPPASTLLPLNCQSEESDLVRGHTDDPEKSKSVASAPVGL